MDFSTLTDEELDTKILTLQKVLYSNNLNLSMQAQNIIGAYLDEQERRMNEKFGEYSEKNDIDMDEIINIG